MRASKFTTLWKQNCEIFISSSDTYNREIGERVEKETEDEGRRIRKKKWHVKAENRRNTNKRKKKHSS